MTDNDIIKALEVCAGIKGTCSAYDCPAFGRISDHRICAMRLKRECYDLINRQKAEIERLKAEIEDSTEIVYICRTDAIKEFAEKLKAKATTRFDWNDCVDIEDIDNLVKEMTEGNNEKRRPV